MSGVFPLHRLRKWKPRRNNGNRILPFLKTTTKTRLVECNFKWRKFRGWRVERGAGCVCPFVTHYPPPPPPPQMSEYMKRERNRMCFRPSPEKVESWQRTLRGLWMDVPTALRASDPDREGFRGQKKTQSRTRARIMSDAKSTTPYVKKFSHFYKFAGLVTCCGLVTKHFDWRLKF